MADTVLASTKMVLGGEMVPTAFDDQILMHINTVFMTLDQLGVTVAIKHVLSDTTWEDAIPDIADNEAIKTYVGLKVRLIFDPPTISSVLSSLESMIEELEWRIRHTADTPYPTEEETSGSSEDDIWAD